MLWSFSATNPQVPRHHRSHGTTDPRHHGSHGTTDPRHHGYMVAWNVPGKFFSALSCLGPAKAMSGPSWAIRDESMCALVFLIFFKIMLSWPQLGQNEKKKQDYVFFNEIYSRVRVLWNVPRKFYH